MAQLTSQLRSRISGHIRGQTVKVGTVYWASLADAKHDIDSRLGELILAPAPVVVAAAEVSEKKILVRNEGWPTDRFSRIERAWEGKTVVCIGGGTSVTAEQIEVVRRARDADRCRVIVINSTFLNAPWADVLYFADAKWWSWFARGKEKSDEDKAAFKAFAGEKCTIWVSGNAVSDAAVHMVRVFEGAAALSLDASALATGSNSGHQAMNMAALSGAGRILLLGYDAKAGRDGRKHHHPDHPDRSAAPYETMLGYIPKLASELAKIRIPVVNCSMDSALKCFPMGRIEECLAPGP